MLIFFSASDYFSIFSIFRQSDPPLPRATGRPRLKFAKVTFWFFAWCIQLYVKKLWTFAAHFFDYLRSTGQKSEKMRNFSRFVEKYLQSWRYRFSNFLIFVGLPPPLAIFKGRIRSDYSKWDFFGHLFLYSKVTPLGGPGRQEKRPTETRLVPMNAPLRGASIGTSLVQIAQLWQSPDQKR